MTTYFGLVHKSRSGFDITVPDLPGCTASADTIDAARRAGAEAMRLWAETVVSSGRAVPEPRDLDDIAKDPDVAYEIKQGALPVALPLLLDAGRTQRVQISLDAGLVAAIDDAAKARGLTRSGFLASAARDKIAG
ncbi:MAG: type II toxin-antitoxin system HicB family antitoxin [Proteobacteria bacterium]|nr:type II toxin-antitoxin system HicB family antitoxin [Pseudomonadota bacterium]